MRNLLYTVLIFLLVLSACSKTETADTNDPNLPNVLSEDTGCIERQFLPPAAHSIKPADIPVINALFIKNGIDNSKLRYFQYIHDTLKTLYPPYTKYDEKNVRVDQYANGVRVFQTTFVYLFLDDSLHYKAGRATNGTSLDTIPVLKLAQLRKLFIDDAERLDHAGSSFKNVCLKAEFGYYNLNQGISSLPELLVKAWKVTPKNSSFPSEYPVGYYQDKNGKLIYYNNGTIID